MLGRELLFEDLVDLALESSLETLGGPSEAIDYEKILYEALVNEGVHTRVINAPKRAQYTFSEKQLRDEAAAEVAAQAAQADIDAENKESRKRKSINADEKLQINRDRNREHAKNTRLRKKAYVVKLKKMVDDLTAQRFAEEAEQRSIGMRILETQTIRKNVVRLLLSYRSTNMRDRDKWAVILDESFQMTLPITPYRSFPKHNIVNSSHVVTGIDAVIADTASLALMAQSVCYGTPQWQAAIKCGQGCRLTYTVGNDEIVAAGEWVMCRFSLRTEGGEMVGALYGCVQHGMLQAHFNRENKLVAAEMVFDVMGFMQQLQRASSISPETSIVPNTIDMALLPSKEVRAIINAKPPLNIVHVNEEWCALYNMPVSSLEGVPFCKVIAAPQPQAEQLLILANECANGKPVGAVALVHSRLDRNEPALIYLKLFPLTRSSDKSISHLLVVQTDLPLSAAEAQAVRQHLHGNTGGVSIETVHSESGETEVFNVAAAAAAAAAASASAAAAAAATTTSTTRTRTTATTTTGTTGDSYIPPCDRDYVSSDSVLNLPMGSLSDNVFNLPMGSLYDRLNRNRIAIQRDSVAGRHGSGAGQSGP